MREPVVVVAEGPAPVPAIVMPMVIEEEVVVTSIVQKLAF
jgi:hypothetical protein